MQDFGAPRGVLLVHRRRSTCARFWRDPGGCFWLRPELSNIKHGVGGGRGCSALVPGGGSAILRWVALPAGSAQACRSFCASSKRLMEPGAVSKLPGLGCGKVIRYTIRLAPDISLLGSAVPSTGSCEGRLGPGPGPFITIRRRTKDNMATKRSAVCEKARAEPAEGYATNSHGGPPKTVPVQCPCIARTVPETVPE